jgi:hypothetical protein
MLRYRLDEHLHLSQGISRRRTIWLEEIEIAEDGEIYYTEHYVQINLVKLLKYLKRYPLIKPMENNLSPSELVQAYLKEKNCFESLSQQLTASKERRDSFESQIRQQLIQPNEYAPLLIDGNILVQLIDGYLSVSSVTKL